MILATILLTLSHASDTQGLALDRIHDGVALHAQERLEHAALNWALQKVERWETVVAVTLSPSDEPRESPPGPERPRAFLMLSDHASPENAQVQLRKLVVSISSGFDRVLPDVGDQCFLWERPPERGGCMLRLRSGRYVLTVAAPLVSDATALAYTFISLLADLPECQPTVPAP